MNTKLYLILISIRHILILIAYINFKLMKMII